MAKKIFCLLISFVFLFSVFKPVFAYAEYGSIEEKVNLFVSLGIIDKRDAENEDYFKSITKKEFIGFVCRMLGASSFGEETKEVLTTAYNMGLIKSISEDNDGPLSFDEAVTILVRATGHEFKAENSGGFPLGYIKTAQSLGITKGIDFGNDRYLKLFEAINLLYNMFDVNVARLHSITSDGGRYVFEDGTDVFNEYRDIYKIEGIVGVTDNSYLRANYSGMDGKALIGDIEVKGSISDDLLGVSVIAFVKKNNDELELLHTLKDRNNIILLESKDVKEVDSSFKALTYYDKNNKDKKISISPSAAFIYNGLPYSDFKTSDFKPDDGSVELIDNDCDNTVDVIKINSYKTVIVNTVSDFAQSVENIYKYDEENLILDLYQNGDDNKVEIYFNGEVGKISNIERYNVLRVMEAKHAGKKRITVELSKEVVSGTVSTIMKNDETVVTVGNRELVVSKAYENALAKKDPKAKEIVVGSEYSFYLDNLGRIAYAELSENNLTYAIVKGVAADRAIDITYKLKVFTENAEWKIYTICDKVTYNGSKTTGADAGEKLKEMVSPEGAIIVIGFRLNGNDEINLIEAEMENTSDEERLNVQKNILCTYREENQSLNTRLFMNPDAVIFRVNISRLDEDKAYTVQGISMFTNAYGYNISAYDVDKYGFGKVFVVTWSDDYEAMNAAASQFAVVRDAGECIVDGEICTYVTVSMGYYEEMTAYTDDKELLAGVKTGDIVSFAYDERRDLSSVDRYYSIEDEGKTFKSAPSLFGSPVILAGNIKKYDSERYFIDLDCGDTDWVVRTITGPSVQIYDRESKKVYLGSLNDLTEGSFVVAKVSYLKLLGLVIIK